MNTITIWGKTIFNWIGADWKRVKNHCRTTVNKEFSDVEPTEEFKRSLLISEHTPIRLIEVDWSWKGIKSWVSVHWTRHKHEKFVSTQRDDRKEHEISRDEMPQGTLVNMDNYANAQQLIDIFRKRLCYQASPETKELADDFKIALYKEEPELSEVLVPNCIYRCGCPEFKRCGFWAVFLHYVNREINGKEDEFSMIVDSYKTLTDISERYKLYNDFFWSTAGVPREEKGEIVCGQ